MNSFAYFHSKFENIIVHLFFNVISYLVLPMSCGEFYTTVFVLLEEPIHDKFLYVTYYL